MYIYIYILRAQHGRLSYNYVPTLLPSSPHRPVPYHIYVRDGMCKSATWFIDRVGVHTGSVCSRDYARTETSLAPGRKTNIILALHDLLPPFYFHPIPVPPRTIPNQYKRERHRTCNFNFNFISSTEQQAYKY